MHNYYKLLGIPTSASIQQIKAAYKTIAKKYHPDMNRSLSEDERIKKQNFLAIITNGYEILTNPTKKNRYDLKLKYGVDKVKKQRTNKNRKENSYDERKAAAFEKIKRKKEFDNKNFIKYFENKTKYLSYHKIQILTIFFILFGFKSIVLSFPMNNAVGSYNSLQFLAGLIILFSGIVYLVNSIYQKKKYEGLIQKKFINFNRMPTLILILSFVLGPFIIRYTTHYRKRFLRQYGETAITHNFEIDIKHQFINYTINNKKYSMNKSNIDINFISEAHNYRNNKLNNTPKYFVQYSVLDPRIISLVKIE